MGLGGPVPDWRRYQEEAASFFRTLGLEAATDVSLQGVRTSHAIDVVVTSQHAGFRVTWLVECKHWQTPVTKLHVLALREIVSDLGADRGILLCEEGFQSGAMEAAYLTNVQVTSLAALSIEASTHINAMRLHELYDRVDACDDSYWEISKETRKALGLRPEFMQDGYSGAHVIEVSRDLLTKAFRGVYPITVGGRGGPFDNPLPERFDTCEELVAALDNWITEMEAKLAAVGLEHRPPRASRRRRQPPAK